MFAARRGRRLPATRLGDAPGSYVGLPLTFAESALKFAAPS